MNIRKQIFAVVSTIGRQYKVTEGDVLQVPFMEAPIDSEIRLDRVHLVGTPIWTAIGTPFIDNAEVRAIVEGHQRSRKILIFKKKRKSTTELWKGRRTPITMLRILEIKYEPENEDGNIYDDMKKKESKLARYQQYFNTNDKVVKERVP
eukprot:NODE_10518_length_509_cov_24.049223_g9870_i0.p1 GENE.NODE_10518_length_509_cov_24.049223_g9870_i0~~NODE_10518_length_509_cov_24.049223_g9870_i0.p1  ORF type:complete len:167 (+),score=47.62 NODE_10518_length_509_cov_24.049223_g9870_i0:56-502(+)